ncbi:alcohol dehydrogenase catalytic domain-containing protein [Rhodobacteraceae bacterium R_SAG2]|nr:alcohol dehydrogenase catalytic domain-containing protein [Rhodobacteraceae bacterium R_SAG2]
MRAYVMKSAQHGAVRRMPKPIPGHGEVRIRSRFVGICGSDVHAYVGHYVRRRLPLAPGHEVSGIVDALGPDVIGPELGTPVVVNPEIGCGHCAAGWSNLCCDKVLMGTRPWPGAFAEYFCAPCDNLFALPDGINLRAAALTEPVSVAVHALRKVENRKCEPALVIGAGGIGSTLLVAAKLMGWNHVTVSDVVASKLKVASALGADAVVDVAGASLSEELSRNGLPAPGVIFVAASGPTLIDLCFATARSRAAIVLLGQFSKAGIIDIDKGRIREQPIFGRRDFVDAGALHSENAERFSPLINRVVSLDTVDDVIREMATGYSRATKIMIDLGE